MFKTLVLVIILGAIGYSLCDAGTSAINKYNKGVDKVLQEV